MLTFPRLLMADHDQRVNHTNTKARFTEKLAEDN